MSAKIIPFKDSGKKDVDVKCAFCGTPKSKAKKMVVGIKASICDKCVTQAKLRAESCDSVEQTSTEGGAA